MTDQPRGLSPTAYEIEEGQQYVPYVPQQTGVAEFTIKSVVAGIILGIVFGAANAYLGLMAGLTISTSIPVSVLTVVVFRSLKKAGVQHTILEANMSQTIGSASSSVASGVIFTIPALFLWGLDPPLAQLTLLAMSGGLIGVLAMIPLRRYLIVQEHGKLPYPEGLACAEVLVASEEGGSQAVGVFWGLGVGAVFKLLTDGLKLVGTTFSIGAGKVVVAAKVSPALVGVGYILGPRIASVMVAGGALSALAIIPLIDWIGADWTTAVYPGEIPISQMTAEDIWYSYIRYIGAGAVATAGIITLVRSLPVMVESFTLSLSQMRQARDSAAIKTPRTEQDLPLPYVGGGLLIVLLLLILVPGVLGFLDSLVVKAASAVLIAVFAFFFVTVASRIVGMIGVTSNPTSGMTIATLIGTSLIFYFMGWTDLEGKATALMVGTAVCIAASIAGDTSQDLKTGFLLGATPRLQQIGELAGVIASSLFVCYTIVALHESIGIGSAELPAPQATLMQLVIDGVIEQNLPWNLILIGAGLAVVAVLLRLPSLAFAVGVYLPLSTMAPVFLGGLLRWWITRRADEKVATKRRKRGVLFSSGLVGGEGLMGVGIAMYVLLSGQRTIAGIPLDLPGWAVQIISVLAIVAILALIAFVAKGMGQDEAR